MREWPIVRFGRTYQVRDERAGSDTSYELMSVSQTHGVVPRHSLMGDSGRSTSLTNYKICHPGDIVINRMSAYNGALGVARDLGVVSPDYLVLQILPGNNSDFLASWLRTPLGIFEMSLRLRGIGGVGANQVRTPRVNESDLRLIPIPLPPIAEQRAIADYLDRETAQIDTLIEEQQRLIALLQERRSAAIETHIQMAPPVTTGQRLKHLTAEVRQGWSPQCYPWSSDGKETWGILKAGAANRGQFRPRENKELPETERPRLATVVRRGDLLVSRANTRELVGSAAVVDGDYPRLMLCDKLYSLTLKDLIADPSYVSACLGTARYRGLIELEATGSSPSMQNISQSDILNLPMDLPSVSDQHRIVAHLDEQTAKIDQLIVETERFIELSKERRSALITAAVTGQIDVQTKESGQ